MPHHLTIDVEEYFHAHAVRRWIGNDDWENMPRRAAPIVDRLIQVLDAHGAKGTFFVLGWLAEREPGMVRRIAQAGHEVASHGWAHRRVTELSPVEFRKSVRKTKALLERLSGTEIVGFRAPSFSIVPGVEWALDILLAEGYRYDSSVFPVATHPSYGYPGAQVDPHWIPRPGGLIAEIPPATLRRFGHNLPAAGGAYLRFLPLGLLIKALNEIEQRNSHGTIYLHPWECDVPQGRELIPFPIRVRMYHGYKKTWSTLETLLTKFEFVPSVKSYQALQKKDIWRQQLQDIAPQPRTIEASLTAPPTRGSWGASSGGHQDLPSATTPDG